MGALSQRGSRGWWLIILRWAAALVVLGLLLHFLPVAPLRAAIARVPVSIFCVVLLGYLLAHASACSNGGWWSTQRAPSWISDERAVLRGRTVRDAISPFDRGWGCVRLAVGLRRSPRPAAVLTGNLLDRCLDVASQGGLVLLGLLLAPKLDVVRTNWKASWRMLSSLWRAALIVLLGVMFRLRKRILAAARCDSAGVWRGSATR